MKQFNKFPKRRRFGQRDYVAPRNCSPYEHSVWLLNTFSGRTVTLNYNESFEQLFRRFKRVVEASGVMKELKRREHYVTKSQRRKEKKKKAEKRFRKNRKQEEALLGTLDFKRVERMPQVNFGFTDPK